MEIGKLANVSELMAYQPSSPVTPEERVQQQQLIKAVASINSANLLGQSRQLAFSYGRQDKKMRLQIVDRTSREVLLEVPSDDVLRLANGSASSVAFVGKLQLG